MVPERQDPEDVPPQTAEVEPVAYQELPPPPPYDPDEALITRVAAGREPRDGDHRTA